jgi:hypothetical protein
MENSNIYTALSAFQSECPAIHKDATGYGYNYADFGTMVETIKPILQKHGLGFYQPLDGTRLKTVVFHIESGDTIESTVEIPQGIELKGMNQFQVLGSGITYLRRYSLASILGLVTDMDSDAAGEQTNKPTIKQDRDVRI